MLLSVSALTGMVVSREKGSGAYTGAWAVFLRTKHLLWPVIKALGNNRHDIHLDKHTHTLLCVCEKLFFKTIPTQ